MGQLCFVNIDTERTSQMFDAFGNKLPFDDEEEPVVLKSETPSIFSTTEENPTWAWSGYRRRSGGTHRSLSSPRQLSEIRKMARARERSV